MKYSGEAHSRQGGGGCKCKGPGAGVHLIFKSKRLEQTDQRGQDEKCWEVGLESQVEDGRP